ncbi:hypothetical protein DYB32_000772 [Aphanomyces invadans]|uniref:PI3K/PI4K catalytic domain-containing protein n=1 Tax=Aphanomyces invadans TaxID=157072 RepID=A0A3R6W3V5_9STRA|nr:hypothetical protein DYB32_000772 [Aphanomyces invadans]
MISMWKHRKNVAFINSLCDELRKLTNTRPILDQVEFYLPQKELPMEAMEQFVMLLSLSSSHFALQFFWIVYGALDEHRPKKNGNPRTFTRCAQLLVILEQCFIYGSPELFANQQISKAEMNLILKADRRFFAAQSSACMTLVDDSFDGYSDSHGPTLLAHFAAPSSEDLQLWVDNLESASAPPGPPPSSPSKVPGGGPSRAIERMSDRMRSFILEPERRNSDDQDGDASDCSRRVHVEDGIDKAHEVSMAAPVDVLTKGEALPDQQADATTTRSRTSSAGKAQVHLTQEEQMRYDFFTDQITFVKSITDICEDLRLVDASKRKELLPIKLRDLDKRLPTYAYLPLCRSTDHFYHVTAVCADDGYVFKTHVRTPTHLVSISFVSLIRLLRPCQERAPCLMHFVSTPNASHWDVSTALFTYLHAHDEHIETNVQCDAAVPSASTPFLDELLLDDDRRAKIHAIFGELKCEKTARLARAYPGDGAFHLESFIAKVGPPPYSVAPIVSTAMQSYDDLRQEVLVMQLISYLDNVFARDKLPLKLHPYRILSTGASTGLIELVANATSFDGLKKTAGFKSLRAHFETLYGDTNSTTFHTAMTNFIQSLGTSSAVVRRP